VPRARAPGHRKTAKSEKTAKGAKSASAKQRVRWMTTAACIFLGVLGVLGVLGALGGSKYDFAVLLNLAGLADLPFYFDLLRLRG